MVLKKWSGYGFNGSQTPAVLRVPRSAKGRRSVRRKAGDKQMCAFDLLAAVAGELLSAKSNLSTPKSNAIKSSSTSSVAPKLEELLEEKPFRDEASVQGSHTKSLLDPKAPNHRQNTSFKEHLCMLNGALSGPSVIGKSDVSCKDVGWMNMLDGNKGEFGYPFDAKPEVCCITERHSPCEAESREARAVDEVRKTQQSEQRTDRNLADGSAPVLCSSRGSVQLDSGPRALVSSKCSSVVPSSNDGFHCSSSFPSSPDNLKQPTDRDDDEKSSRCTYSSTINSKALRPQRIGNRRIRKLLSSKYWRAAPTMSRNGDLPNTDVYRKSAFNGRKICYTRRRTQKSPFKRRMVFERHSILGCDAELSCECTSNLAKMDVKAEAINSCTFLREANSTSSSINGHRPSHESEDFHVNIRIKSFKVPELFIEIPETATVGSLKKMVMEAVTTIFGGGLRVGLLLQGKKVRDDNKTLLQAGISHDDKLDNLGFSLEPNPSVQPVSVTSSGGAHLLLAYKASEPETRYKEALPPTPQSADPGKSIAHPELPLSSVVNSPESDHDSVHCPVDASLRDKATADSRALVPVPDMSIEALAMVPMPKPKRSDLAQRRARRPFSVSEVEALVQAVEKLGTGRWRDVKIRAFNNANHRTYVDLKDKWKTLVHTAKISPQQRRGEPVPQELLDRVLAAHAHWSQHQAKFSSKPSSLDARPLN